MRLRLERIRLDATDRHIEFTGGLNVVVGPISTGKSTLLRLCRILLGAPVEDVPPEIRDNVPAVSGRLLIGGQRYDVVRPLVGTDTAKVDIAGRDETWRLPAMRRDATAPTTYGRWLLERLGLPLLDVPTAPTRPAESPSSPLSINDFMLYCHLPQDDIDSSVFGSRDNFKNIKRRYVFEVLYGLYDVEIAQRQEELRSVQAELRQLQSGTAAFERFFVDTAWENRAQLVSRLEEARDTLRSVEDEASVRAHQAADSLGTGDLRARVQELDAEIARSIAGEEQEARSIADLDELRRQLETQTARLTRSIVANRLLLDFDFRVCPRCGSDITSDRAQEPHCYLCLQPPGARLTREDLVREQDRLTAQILETQELVQIRRERAHASHATTERLRHERDVAARDLTARTRSFISDQADSIADNARRREEAVRLVAQLSDYLRLFEKLDAAAMRIEELARTAEGLEAHIEARLALNDSVEERIGQLESNFASLVEEVGLPRFPGEPRAAISRETYLPIVNGRTFNQLSSGGLKVLTNVAHALAHHETALAAELHLPGLLLLDGVTKNVGRDEYDWARVEAVFHALMRLSDTHGDHLQIIVSANDVPDFAQDRVRLRLSDADRLVPTSRRLGGSVQLDAME